MTVSRCAARSLTAGTPTKASAGKPANVGRTERCARHSRGESMALDSASSAQTCRVFGASLPMPSASLSKGLPALQALPLSCATARLDRSFSQCPPARDLLALLLST